MQDTQLELFPIQQIRYSKARMAEAFEEFDSLNPHVYRNLRTLAIEHVRKRGKTGAKLLVEILRWEYAIQTRHAEDEYRINNNWTAFYARKLMQEPELSEAFETRRQRSA